MLLNKFQWTQLRRERGTRLFRDFPSRSHHLLEGIAISSQYMEDAYAGKVLAGYLGLTEVSGRAKAFLNLPQALMHWEKYAD